MSDSDSDFAYESAGEDGELGDNAVDDEMPAIQNKAGSTVHEDVECTETERTQSAVTNTDRVEDRLTTEATKEAESLTLSDKIVDNAQDNVQCLENTNQPSPIVETSNEKETASKEANLVSLETEPKRVQLRLEKKLMEKSQPAPRKTAPDVSIAEEPTTVPVPEEKNSSWGWGSWGTSLLSTAAISVTTFTSQVSQGIGTVIETVENTLGAPPPEELAVSLAHKETSNPAEVSEEIVDEATKEETEESKAPTASLFSGVTSLTKAIENTGTKVLMGGLDTLELIGKKTIDILTEGDPGLRNKRAALSEGMTLSQILRDAQNKAEERKSSESDEIQETVLYTQFFDEFQGLVHLEALEMLSKQCQSKVQSMLNTVSNDVAKKFILDEIKDICEDLPSSDDSAEEENLDFAKLLSEHMEALNLPLNSSKLMQVQVTALEMIHAYQQLQGNTDGEISKEIYRQAISCLAEFTAKCVEHFHKIGELILVQPNMQLSVTDCATHLTELTSVLSIETGSLAGKFCDCLNVTSGTSEDQDSVTPLITSVYLEASNSTTYIQDAFQLLVPVLQLLALQ